MRLAAAPTNANDVVTVKWKDETIMHPCVHTFMCLYAQPYHKHDISNYETLNATW